MMCCDPYYLAVQAVVALQVVFLQVCFELEVREARLVFWVDALSLLILTVCLECMFGGGQPCAITPATEGGKCANPYGLCIAKPISASWRSPLRCLVSCSARGSPNVSFTRTVSLRPSKDTAAYKSLLPCTLTVVSFRSVCAYCRCM